MACCYRCREKASDRDDAHRAILIGFLLSNGVDVDLVPDDAMVDVDLEAKTITLEQFVRRGDGGIWFVGDYPVRAIKVYELVHPWPQSYSWWPREVRCRTGC